MKSIVNLDDLGPMGIMFLTRLAAARPICCVPIGQELIARGRRMYFTTAALLVQDLPVAKRDLKLSRLIKKLGRLKD
jgi:hypothetical protein